MDPATLARLALLAAVLAVANGNGGAPVTANPTIGAATTRTYIVQAGDTLYSIARKFNTTIEALQQANQITNPNALAVGQRLIIPGASVAQNPVTPTPTARGPTPTQTACPECSEGSNVKQPVPNGMRDETPSTSGETETYIVKAGDTLASIGAAFGVSLQELMRVNNITNPNLISVGQRLIILKAANTQTLPAGIVINPQVVKQGETLTIKVTMPNVSQVQGKFDQQELKFNRIGEEWVALAGISRCANFVGNYPVVLTVRDGLGNPQPVQFDVHVNAGTFGVQDLTLTLQMSALLDPALINAENARVGQTVSIYTPGQMWNGKFRLPLDVKNPRISTSFGERRSYNGSKPGLCGHEGTDYAVAGGTPVYAPADGVVVMATPLKVRGNVVFIDHGRGVFTAFYHLKEIDAQNGQRVQAGELVGKVGTTGFSTGDHLHWSMWVNGVYVNPAQWMEESIP